MTNAVAIKIKHVNLKLFKINIWIIIHLGRNPKNGGNPPSDKILIDQLI